MKQTYAILDLQYGSTGKGLLAGYLARRRRPDGVVCAFGPNAGHTFIDRDGNKYVHIMMPMGALSPDVQTVFIGPGAVVHPELLHSEYENLRLAGARFRLVIHEHATVVQERHREQEAEYGGAIGSTQKGTGAALAEKIRRDLSLQLPIAAKTALANTVLEDFVVSRATYNTLMDGVETLQVEGAQGFSLSIHHGFYPFTTSRDCTLASLLSDCAVPLEERVVESYGVCRTYPIRVNNKTGWSGPHYDDQKEIEWKDIGVEPELTTVTRLPRRIFTFSTQQIVEAVRMNNTSKIFLNFCNYPCDYGHLADKINMHTSAKVHWLGMGPSENYVMEIR